MPQNFITCIKNLSKLDWAVCAASCAMGMACFFLIPLQFTSDSIDYYQWGLGILHMPGGRLPYHRTAGYPLLLILTGAYWLGSFFVTEVVQMLLAVATPILLYFTVKPFSARAAAGAALLIVALWFPYMYARVLYTESAYLFFLTMIFYTATRYVRFGKGLWSLLLFGTIAALIKPTAQPLFPLALLVLFFFARPPMAEKETEAGWAERRFPLFRLTSRNAYFARVLLAFFAVSLTHSVIRYYTVQGITGNYSHAQISSLTAGSSMAGKMLFWQVYGGLTHFNVNTTRGEAYSLVSEKNGPASKRLFAVLRDFLHNNKGNWVTLGPPEYFSAFKDDPDALLARMFKKPNLTYHWFIWIVLDMKLGPKEANHLLTEVSLEAFRQFPYAIFGLYNNFTDFFFGESKIYNAGIMQIGRPALCCVMNVGDPVPKALQQSLNNGFQVGNSRYLSTLSRIRPTVEWLWVIVRNLMALTALLTLLHGLQSHYRPVILLCWAFLLPQAVLTALFAGPQVRYIDMTLPFLFVAALLGVEAVLSNRKH